MGKCTSRHIFLYGELRHNIVKVAVDPREAAEWIRRQPNRFRELQLRELQTGTYNNSKINFLDRFSETNLYSIRKFL